MPFLFKSLVPQSPPLRLTVCAFISFLFVTPSPPQSAQISVLSILCTWRISLIPWLPLASPSPTYKSPMYFSPAHTCLSSFRCDYLTPIMTACLKVRSSSVHHKQKGKVQLFCLTSYPLDREHSTIQPSLKL